MTSEEYARLVHTTISDARQARDIYEDDHKLAWAFKELADGAAHRCLTVGTQYEVHADEQQFEAKTVAEALIECRQEALDVPAYLTQVAYHLGNMADPDVREGIEHAARLVLVIDRLAAKATGNE